MSLVTESRGGFDDLCKIVTSFDKTKSTIVREDLETPGFYIIEGKLKAYHLTNGESGSLPKQPSITEVNKCIDVIEKLVPKYKRIELVPTALKWGIAAPFSFALRQYTEDITFLPWLYPYGRTRTGKSTLGYMALAIWRKYHDSKSKVPFSKVDTPARFGNTISKTTLPLVINEVGALGEFKYKDLLEMFKNSIETRIARGKYFQKTDYRDIPALSACVLTGNPRPATDSGFQSRVIPYPFTKEDEHSNEEKKQFKAFFINEVVPNIGLLGDFTANYVMNHPESLLRPNKEDCDAIKFATSILKEFYLAANRNLPDWIDSFVEEHTLEFNSDETRLQIRAFFIYTINDAFQRYSWLTGSDDANATNAKTLDNRLQFCLDLNAIPFLTRTQDGNTIVIFSNVMKEMYNNSRFGIDRTEIASMQELAHVMGLEYGQKWLNGANTRVVFGDYSKLLQFIGSEISDQNPEETENKTSPNGDITGIEKFILPDGVYRIGRTDKFGCKFCNVKDDRWGMAKHQCSRKKS